jgi:hypothetical protein
VTVIQEAATQRFARSIPTVRIPLLRQRAFGQHSLCSPTAPLEPAESATLGGWLLTSKG